MANRRFWIVMAAAAVVGFGNAGAAFANSPGGANPGANIGSPITTSPVIDVHGTGDSAEIHRAGDEMAARNHPVHSNAQATGCEGTAANGGPTDAHAVDGRPCGPAALRNTPTR